MAIDEAINKYENIARDNRNEQNYWAGNIDEDDILSEAERGKLATDCEEIAEEYEQFVKWLRELKEAKRLLKMAVEDISTMPCNNDTHRPESCYICVKHGNCSYADSFKWCKADIALKLIGEDENET